MSSQSTNEALKAQSMPQGECQMTEGFRSADRLRCPMRIAYPTLCPASKTCDNNRNGIRRVKDHLYTHHQCICPGQPEPCQNPLHLGPKKLKELKAIRRRRGEISGEQWRRIYDAIHPNQNKNVPAPYVPSASDLKAIACAPPPGFTEKLAENVDDAHRFLANVPHFIDLACLMGPYPDPQSAVPRRSNNTIVSAAHTSEQGPVVAERGEPAYGALDWEKYFNLEQDTY